MAVLEVSNLDVHYGAIHALRGLSSSVGRIAGPIAAGVLVATVGAGWALAVDAATFAVSAALLAGIRLPRQAAAPRRSFLADLREGWTAFRSRTWLWSFGAIFARSTKGVST